MRLVVWGAVLAVLGTAPLARADIYLQRDRFGVLHFTNAPTDRTARMVIKDRPVSARVKVLASTPTGVLGVGLLPAAKALGRLLPARVGKVLLPRAERTAYDPLIQEIAERHGVEYALVKAVIQAESGFDRLAVSPKGALGLMQLMPATAAEHQVHDVFRPRDNIEGGVRYLRWLLDRYGGNVPLALAAYNAGPGRVEDAGGVPLIPETREYLARVLRYRMSYMRGPGDALQILR
jgi:soluble lytic murein transglycosylase-like protein